MKGNIKDKKLLKQTMKEWIKKKTLPDVKIILKLKRLGYSRIGTNHKEISKMNKWSMAKVN